MNPRRKLAPQGPGWSDFTLRRSAARKGNAPDPGREARQYALYRPRGIKTAAQHIIDLSPARWAKVLEAKARSLEGKSNQGRPMRLPRHLKRRLKRKYPRSAAHRVRQLNALGVTQADVLEHMKEAKG